MEAVADGLGAEHHGRKAREARSRATVLKVVVSLALVSGAVAYLLGGSIGGSMVFDRTVDQLLAESESIAGQRVRVGGRLAAGSLHRPEGRAEHEFALDGQQRDLVVRFAGLWPDAAIDGRELMVEGTLLEDGTVRADRVLARCPSRYKSRVETAEPTGPAPTP